MSEARLASCEATWYFTAATTPVIFLHQWQGQRCVIARQLKDTPPGLTWLSARKIVTLWLEFDAANIRLPSLPLWIMHWQSANMGCPVGGTLGTVWELDEMSCPTTSRKTVITNKRMNKKNDTGCTVPWKVYLNLTGANRLQHNRTCNWTFHFTRKISNTQSTSLTNSTQYVCSDSLILCIVNSSQWWDFLYSKMWTHASPVAVTVLSTSSTFRALLKKGMSIAMYTSNNLTFHTQRSNFGLLRTNPNAQRYYHYDNLFQPVSHGPVVGHDAFAVSHQAWNKSEWKHYETCIMHNDVIMIK